MWRLGNVRGIFGLWVTLLIAAGDAVPRVLAAGEPRAVQPAAEVADWKVHGPTGRVFGALADRNMVVEYDVTGAVVRNISVDSPPTRLLIKHDRLVIACPKTTSLHVFDLKKDELEESVLLRDQTPIAMFCSQADNPYVYCLCRSPDRGIAGDLLQVDLKTRKVTRQQILQNWRPVGSTHAVMSADGKRVVADARGFASPSGAGLMKFDEEDFSFVNVRDYQGSFGPIVAGPLNRDWALGEHLYTFDLSHSSRSFAGAPVAIHPKWDLAASIASNELALERFSDATLIERLKLPDEIKLPGENPADGSSPDPTLQFDLRHNALFFGTARHACWLDLAPFQEKFAVLRRIAAPPEFTWNIDESRGIPVEFTNGALPAGLELRMTQGPKGAVLRGHDIVWQPSTEDVGDHVIQLQLSAVEDGKVLDTADVRVEVTRPRIHLGFTAHAMEMSLDGGFLFVWGAVGGEVPHTVQPGPHEVAVIDLRKSRLLVRKSMAQGVRCAAIDEKFVYIAPASGNIIYRLNHALEDGARQFLQFPPQQLWRIGPDRLAVVANDVLLFDVEKMVPAPPAELPSPGIEPQPAVSSYNKGMASHSRGIVQMFGRVVDGRTGKTWRLSGVASLPCLTGDAGSNRAMMLAFRNASPLPSQWGRQLSHAILTNHRGSQIAQWSSNGSDVAVFADDWPGFVTVATAVDGRTVHKTLEVRSVVDGAVRYSAPLESSTQRNSPYLRFGSRTMLVHGHTVYYATNDEIVLVSIPEGVTSQLRVPTHFLVEQQTELEVEKSVSFPLRVGGEREGITFTLLDESPGVAIDARQGTLTIDTEALWKNLVSRIPPGEIEGSVLRSTAQPPSRYSRGENARHYKFLTGKDLPEDKFAAQLPVHVNLRDVEGQEDTIHFHVVVSGPRKAIDDAIELRKAEQAKRMAERVESQRKAELARNAAPARPGNQTPSQPGTTAEERLNELEARMRRIEAALDSILKRLDEKK